MILKSKIEKTSRTHKVSEIIRKAISEVLIKNEMPLNAPFKFPISVVKVEMNSDLRIAYIYVITHEKIEENEIIFKLNSCRHYLSREVTSLINLKFSPKLIFRIDKSIDEISNIEKVLSKIRVSNNLHKN